MNALLAEAEQTLDRHGLRLVTTQGRAAVLDAGSRGRFEYTLYLRPDLTAHAARALPAAVGNALVVAHHVSREAGDALKRNGIDYLDAVGNISIDLPTVFLHVQGISNRRVQPVGARAPGAFTRAGVQVLYVLLSQPDFVGFPLRAIAETAGVSLGTVANVMTELESAEFVYKVDSTRRLANGRHLLDQWVEAFADRIAPRLTLGHFYDHDGKWWQRSRDMLADNNAQLGGEAGGVLLDSDLNPTTAIVYCDALPTPLIAARRWTRRPDANVEVRQRFWREPEYAPIVASPLIYADMWASGDPRQRAHAQRIRAHDPRLVELDRS
jgi:hypothetical protein